MAGRMVPKPDRNREDRRRPDQRRENQRRENRRRADRQGRIAEWVAIAYLGLAGHRILARRWRGTGGEIDLVARRGGRMMFCEVKYRQSEDRGAVPSPRQRQRIARAAKEFCRQRRISQKFEMRFDLIQISPFFGGILYRVRHLRDAWWTTPD